MPILIVHPHPHSPLCPNTCLTVTKTQISSAWAQGWEGPSPCKWVWAGWHWGSYVVGEQGDRWHREKHSCLSSCQAPAWCPETTLCSGRLNRSPQVSLHQCQQSSITTGSGDTPQASHPSCPGGHPAWLMYAANSKLGCHNSFFSIRFLHSICTSFG